MYEPMVESAFSHDYGLKEKNDGCPRLTISQDDYIGKKK
jgi:hypothetical protein